LILAQEQGYRENQDLLALVRQLFHMQLKLYRSFLIFRVCSAMLSAEFKGKFAHPEEGKI
jgi:hypothetical protein